MARSVWRWGIGLALVLVVGVAVWLVGALVGTTGGAVLLSEVIDSWYPIQDAKGGYAVEMPTKPIDIMTDLTREIRAYGWTVMKPRYDIGVFYTDLPAVDDPQKTLANMTEILSHTQGVKRVTAQRPIALEEYPGVELEYDFNGGQTGITRVYLMNSRVFYLQFVSTDWEASRVMRTRFFDSFRFLTP